MGPGEAGEAGRRPPGEAPAGEEEALPVGRAGALPELAVGLLPPLLLLLLLAPTDVSVRFKAAGPISAYRKKARKISL